MANSKAYPEEDVATNSSHCEGNMTEEEFFHRLRSFPCLFTDLTHVDRISPESLEALKKKLQRKQRSVGTGKATSCGPGNSTEGSNYDSILVYICWRLQQVEEAKRMAKEALGTYPSSILVRANMAYILRKLGEVPDADSQLRALEAMKQNSAETFRDLVTEAHLGVAYFYYLYRYSKFGLHAIEIYEKILEEQPDNDRCKLYFARVLKKQRPGEVTMKDRGGCDASDKATTTDRKPVFLTPSDGLQSPLDLAIDLLTAIMNKVENNAQLRAEAAAELGGILFGRCKQNVVTEKSRQLGLEPGQCYTQALDLAGDNARVLLYSGTYFGRTGMREKAVRLFERLVKLQPDNAKAHLRLGRTLLAIFWKKQQTQQTARHPGDLHTSNTPSRTDRRSHLTFLTGGQYANTSSPALASTQWSMYVERAEGCFKKAQTLGEGSTMLVFELGRALSALGKYDDALHFLLQVVTAHETPFLTGKALNISAHVLFQVRKKWMDNGRYGNCTSLAVFFF